MKYFFFCPGVLDNFYSNDDVDIVDMELV